MLPKMIKYHSNNYLFEYKTNYDQFLPKFNDLMKFYTLFRFECYPFHPFNGQGFKMLEFQVSAFNYKAINTLSGNCETDVFSYIKN